MREILFRKVLVLVVIFLFISVAIQPVFANDSFDTSSQNLTIEIINTQVNEVSVEICNVDGYNYSVNLTRQQIQELENLFDELKENLDKGNTREETAEIFNETVVSLNSLGLLPKNMTVEQVQKLVTGGGISSNEMKKLEKIFDKQKTKLEENENVFCLIAGKTTKTFIERVSSRITMFFCLFIFHLIDSGIPIGPILDTLTTYAMLWWFLTDGLRMLILNPFSIGNIIGLGSHHEQESNNHYHAAEGWFFSNGQNGKKNWTGSFWGGLPIPVLQPLFTDYYPGATGFTGIRIGVPAFMKNYYYLGTALWVQISYDCPGVY